MQRKQLEAVGAMGIVLTMAGACASMPEEEPSTDEGTASAHAEGLREARNGYAGTLRPILTCIARDDKGHQIAHFGYEYEGTNALHIPVGPLNAFLPFPVNRGQPENFLPGTSEDVVAVPLPRLGWPVEWKLGLRTATAWTNSRACLPRFAGARAATVTSDQSIALSWSAGTDFGHDPSTLVYQICISTIPGECESDFIPAATSSPGATGWEATGLMADTQYYFVVRAQSASGAIDSNAAEVSARTCASGAQACDGACAVLKTDPANCGSCGRICDSGVCSEGGCCQAGETSCAGACTSTSNDSENCGRCGLRCPDGMVCTTGRCCGPGQELCNGWCTLTASDGSNCGGCGNLCPTDKPWCVAGQCAQCGADQAVCDGICTSTASDAANCGTCGHTCSESQFCSNGVCTCLATCEGGCVNPQVDSQNCGSCGHACSSEQTCHAGICIPTHCQDGAKNADESGLDCGGSCRTCLNGSGCRTDADCESRYCNGSSICAYRRIEVSSCVGQQAGTPCYKPFESCTWYACMNETCSAPITTMPCGRPFAPAGMDAQCLTGSCRHDDLSCIPVSNGTPCTKGDPCAVNATCQNGACVSGGTSCVCAPGTRECADGGVRVCQSNGQWGPASACPSNAPVCAAGICSCESGALVCSANGVQQCGPNGELSGASLCSLDVCGANACLADATTLSVGLRESACALTVEGGVVCWGNNSYGQLGNGSTLSTLIPVRVTGLSRGAKAVAVGNVSACAITEGDGVVCWGGDLGASTSTPVQVEGLTSGVIAVSTANGAVCAILETGEMKCWGYNANGQLGNNSTSSSSVPVSVVGLPGPVIAVSVGNFATCAVTVAGEVLCWGHNGYGELGNGSTTDSLLPVRVTGLTGAATAVAMGDYSACAVVDGGRVQCWGRNDNGELGDGSTTPSLSAVRVVGLSSGARGVTVAGGFACAIDGNEGVVCWGYNAHGELGDGSSTNRLTPVPVVGLSKGVSAVSAGGGAYGSGVACAVATGGSVKCWGHNGAGLTIAP